MKRHVLHGIPGEQVSKLFPWGERQIHAIASKTVPLPLMY